VEANVKRRAVYMVVSLCVCEVVMKAKEKNIISTRTIKTECFVKTSEIEKCLFCLDGQ